MSLQRVALASCCFAAVVFGAMSSAFAARVYNDTDQRVEIIGTYGGFYLLQRRRSDSVSWTGTDTITVSYDHRHRRDTELCTIKLIGDSPLTGARYMIIAQSGRTVTCYLCDPENRLMKQNRWNPFPTDVKEFYSPKHGC